MSTNNKKNQYSADSIQALEGMEHVRKRPSMYIGDVGSRGLGDVYKRQLINEGVKKLIKPVFMVNLSTFYS